MTEDEPEAWRAPVDDDTDDETPEPIELDVTGDEDVAALLDEAAREAAAGTDADDDAGDEDPWSRSDDGAGASVWDLDPRDRAASVWDLGEGGDAGASVWDAARPGEPAPAATTAPPEGPTPSVRDEAPLDDEDDEVFRFDVGGEASAAADQGDPPGDEPAAADEDDDGVFRFDVGGETVDPADTPRSALGELDPVPLAPPAPTGGLAPSAPARRWADEDDDGDDEPAAFVAQLEGDGPAAPARPSPGARLLLDDRDDAGDAWSAAEVDADADETLDELLRESAEARAAAGSEDHGDREGDGDEVSVWAVRADPAPGSGTLADRSADDDADDAPVDGWGSDDGVWTFTVEESEVEPHDRTLAASARPDRDTGWSDAATPVTTWPREQGVRGPRPASDAVEQPPTSPFARVEEQEPVGIADASDASDDTLPFAPPNGPPPTDPTGSLGLPVDEPAAEPDASAATPADDATEVHDLLGDLFGDEPLPPAAPAASDHAPHPDATVPAPPPAPPGPDESPAGEGAAPQLAPGAISFSAGGGRRKRRRGRRQG